MVINVGNTTTSCAVVQGERLSGVSRIPTSNLLSDGLAASLERLCRERPCLVASVVPEAAEAFTAVRDSDVRFLTADMLRTVDCSLVDTRTVGADRLANLAAVARLRLAPAIVLDCGTAITTEIVDADYRFLGGAILPGRQLSRRALHEFTAQLPDVAVQDEKPSPAGVNTREAILAGVDIGTLGAVRELIAASQAVLGCSTAHIVAVGGDAPYFTKCLPDVEPAPCDFSLHGLAAIARTLFDPTQHAAPGR